MNSFIKRSLAERTTCYNKLHEQYPNYLYIILQVEGQELTLIIPKHWTTSQLIMEIRKKKKLDPNVTYYLAQNNIIHKGYTLVKELNKNSDGFYYLTICQQEAFG
jgi:hypothetical protein